MLLAPIARAGACSATTGVSVNVMKVRLPTDATAGVGRGLHDFALAALIGGNLFGRVAMHPALTEVSDKAERGKVLN